MKSEVQTVEEAVEVNPKYRRFLRRLDMLIERGLELSDDNKLEQFQHTSGYKWRSAADEASYCRWLVNCENILAALFSDSVHIDAFKDLRGRRIAPRRARNIVAVLEGANEDLRGGYLVDQEFLVAGAVFDDVLQEAKHLHKSGHKDAAAVLGRTVLEDALRRIARRAESDDTGKASSVNQRLREQGVFSKPRWRRVNAMLDVGNEAAHGNFDAYTEKDVEGMLNDVEQVLASEF